MVTGIDCSKDFFDITVLQGEKVLFIDKFVNNKEGFAAMLPHVIDSHVSMEATGPYYLQLAFFLHSSGVRVSVINPLVIRRFSQMQLSRAKTDKKDALAIARFTQIMEPALWVPPSKNILHIRHLETYLEGLKTRLQMLGNQQHSFDSAGTAHTGLLDHIAQELQGYRMRIRETELEINGLINETYKEMAANLRSIPGIGPRSVSLLIILTNGFSSFETHKEVISYFGLAPRIFESGTSVKGKGRICKMGMGQIRKVLYMAAVSAIRCNRSCKELYERLRADGKPYRVALIAAVNKLIKLAFAIAKSGKPYNVNHNNRILLG